MTVFRGCRCRGGPQAQFAFIRHGEAEHNILFRNKTVEEGFKLYVGALAIEVLDSLSGIQSGFMRRLE